MITSAAVQTATVTFDMNRSALAPRILVPAADASAPPDPAQWHSPLTYVAANAGTIKFAFNCDLFVFLNGQLLVNLGGIHSLQTQTIDLTSVRAPRALNRIQGPRDASIAAVKISVLVHCRTSHLRSLATSLPHSTSDPSGRLVFAPGSG